ncbi:hypothetical protein HerbRD11066_25020 [Herbidospora sp. RD11066]
MAQTVKRSYKYRFHPTAGQAEELSRTFGCVRSVYNKALEERTRLYKAEGRKLSYAQSSASLTKWKRYEELHFLNEVSCVPLQQTLRHLHAGLASFFAKRAGYPVFKSRKKLELRSMLAYKTAWYGRELLVIDRWFPSSKRCSTCGSVAESMTLSVRDRVCACGAAHDRDINAAKNILAAGLVER